MPGSSAGTDAFRQRTVASATSSTLGLIRAVLAGDDHARLEDRAFEHHVLLVQRAEQRTQRGFRDFVADLHIVIAIHQHFGFDHRHDTRSWQSAA